MPIIEPPPRRGTVPAMSHVTHLEAAINGATLPARSIQTVHENRPLWVRYDLDAVRRALPREALRDRPHSLWRYRELLPYERDQSVVSLGEDITPLIRSDRLGRRLGLSNLFIKDESRLPTGSFKSRGMAMAVTMARELGIRRLAIPTAGNAGGALAAYCARADIECFVFMPSDTPIVNRLEAILFGARVFLVNGLINDCASIIRAGAERMQWFDMSTLREPYRIEGKKTMGLELAEQRNWRLPHAIFYPTGGGTGLIGMWKAFGELASLGWLNDPAMPRMFSCQSSGCAPIAAAFDRGDRFAEPPANPHTIASGLRVPRALGDFMILDAVRASGGRALAVDENRLIEWMRLATTLEGVSLCPESAACIGAIEVAVAQGHIDPAQDIVLFNTGAAQKYIEAIEADAPSIDHRNIDWSAIERAG